MRHLSFSLRFSIASILLVFLFAAGCNRALSPFSGYGPVFSAVMRNDTGTFRGHNLGDKISTVRGSEDRPAEEDVNFLYYEYRSPDSSTTYNVTYDFDENGLNEIQSDIFLRNPALTDTVFADFRKYFDEHYGKSEEHMGFNVWTIPSERYGNVRINLSDESGDFTAEHGPGKISLWIYPDKD